MQSFHLNVFFTSWTDSICLFRSSYWENFAHCSHYIWMAFFLHELISCRFSHISCLKELWIALITFKWLFFFMNWYPIYLFRSLVWENFALQSLHLNGFFLHELISCKLIQISCLRKFWIAVITFDWLLSFMNWFYMLNIQISLWEKSAMQALHLNGFFSSWADSIPLYRSRYWKKFFSSWTDLICLILE